jgi:hypothetical protein
MLNCYKQGPWFTSAGAQGTQIVIVFLIINKYVLRQLLIFIASYNN